MGDADRPHLKIDSHVVVQLGSELISDSEQAILELVKNSYDADARHCRIHLEPDWLPSPDHPWHSYLAASGTGANGRDVGRILVWDDGAGLSEKAVSEGWLTISASLKRAGEGAQKIETKRGRLPVGDKGLGRLASMRLGDVLLLRTCVEGEGATRRTSFAWSQFRTGLELGSVPVKQDVVGKFHDRGAGTDVEIIDLAEVDFWRDRKNLQSVVARLSTLISPFKQFADFNVEVLADDTTMYLQDLAADALNHAPAKFSMRFSEGRLRMQAWFAKPLFRGARGDENRKRYETLLAPDAMPAALEYFSRHPALRNRGFVRLDSQPGGWLFSVAEEIDWADLPPDPKLPRHQNPGPFEAELSYFLFNDETKQKLAAAQVDVGTIQSLAGVGVFRNGFRVRMGDDWLGLAQGLTSGGFFQLRPRNVLGYFAISNENNYKLVEKSDREGFVDNEAWRGFILLAQRMRKFANDALEGARVAYNDYSKPTDAGATGASATTAETIARSQEQAREAALRLKSGSASLKAAVNRSMGLLTGSLSMRPFELSGAISNDVVQTGKDIEAALETVNQSTIEHAAHADRLTYRNEMLQEQNLRLIEAAAVGLSARTLAHEIATYVNQIDRGTKAAARANAKGDPAAFNQAVLGIGAAIRELRKVVSTIDPLLPGSRSLKKDFHLQDGVRQFFELRGKRATDAGIRLELLGDRGCKIRFAETRFNQVLENLYQNSSYWMKADEGGVKREKVVTAEIKGCTLTWHDSGKGVREAVEDNLFDAYVSDKPISEGRGLGLFIVSSFLQSERCEITLARDRNGNGRRYRFGIDFSGAAVRE